MSTTRTEKELEQELKKQRRRRKTWQFYIGGEKKRNANGGENERQ